MELRTRTRIDQYLGGLLIPILKPLTYLVGLALRRDHRVDIRGDLLFIKMLGGGSLVIAFPALLGIRRAFPDSRLKLLTTEAVRPFAESLGVFDQILTVRDRSTSALVLSTVRCLVQARPVDTVVDLEVYSRLTTILSVLTLARNRIGFFIEDTFWRKNLHTQLVFFNQFSGVFHFYERIARLIHAPVAPSRVCRSHLVRHLKIPAEPETRPASQVVRIAIGHSCSEIGKERLLSPAQWRAILDVRLEGATELHFLGASSDAPAADRIIAALEGLDGCTSVNHCGKFSLEESLRLLASCDSFWGVDSALLHYARLLGLSCASWWGPTDPMSRLKDLEVRNEEVFYRKIPCSPCIHVTGTPPCQGQNSCIQALFGGEEELPDLPVIHTSE